MTIPNFSDNELRTLRLAEDAASPEEIFLAWLLSLPHEVDASEAAAAEIVRFDRARLRSPRAERLRRLFIAAAECASPKGRLS